MTLEDILKAVEEPAQESWEKCRMNHNHRGMELYGYKLQAIQEIRALLAQHPEAVGDGGQYRQHAGDCSIYGSGSNICDCGMFRHNIKLRADPVSQDALTWAAHLGAIDRSKSNDAARLEWRPKGFVPPSDDESYWWVMWDDGSIEPVEARHASRHHYPDRLRWSGPIPMPAKPEEAT